MHVETYTHILPYFQYICKLFNFKISQKKKKAFWESREFSESLICIFLRLNIYLIAILYWCILVRFILDCRRCCIYIIIIRVSLKNENKH